MWIMEAKADNGVLRLFGHWHTIYGKISQEDVVGEKGESTTKC